MTIHLNEDTSSERDFLYNELFQFLLARGIAGASLIRPDAGFGGHHRIHESEHGSHANEHMPIRIEFVESPEKVDSIMPDLCQLLTDGLIEAHDTVVYKWANRSGPIV